VGARNILSPPPEYISVFADIVSEGRKHFRGGGDSITCRFRFGSTAIRECLKLIVKEEMSMFTAMQQKIVAEQTLQKKLIDDHKEMNAVLHKRFDFLDVDSRLSSLIIRGLPEVSYDEKGAPSNDHRLNTSLDNRRTCSHLKSWQRNERSLRCVMMTLTST